MKIVCMSDIAPQPWKNGGGQTRELLAWPNAQAWRVRISVADIEVDGPFSAYPGVARSFVVLSGAGVLLRIGTQEHVCSPIHLPLAFDGAAATHCTLVAGPTRDLNLMTREVKASGWQPTAAASWTSPRHARAVFTREAAQLHTPRDAFALPALSLAVSLDAAGEPWRLESAGPAWWMDWDPTQSLPSSPHETY